MSKYTPLRKANVCRMNPDVHTHGVCPDSECAKCGWNPEVHKARLEELHRLAAAGKLRSEWGKKP